MESGGILPQSLRPVIIDLHNPPANYPLVAPAYRTVSGNWHVVQEFLIPQTFAGLPVLPPGWEYHASVLPTPDLPGAPTWKLMISEDYRWSPSGEQLWPPAWGDLQYPRGATTSETGILVGVGLPDPELTAKYGGLIRHNLHGLFGVNGVCGDARPAAEYCAEGRPAFAFRISLFAGTCVARAADSADRRPAVPDANWSMSVKIEAIRLNTDALSGRRQYLCGWEADAAICPNGFVLRLSRETSRAVWPGPELQLRAQLPADYPGPKPRAFTVTRPAVRECALRVPRAGAFKVSVRESWFPDCADVSWVVCAESAPLPLAGRAGVVAGGQLVVKPTETRITVAGVRIDCESLEASSTDLGFGWYIILMLEPV